MPRKRCESLACLVFPLSCVLSVLSTFCSSFFLGLLLLPCSGCRPSKELLTGMVSAGSCAFVFELYRLRHVSVLEAALDFLNRFYAFDAVRKQNVHKGSRKMKESRQARATSQERSRVAMMETRKEAVLGFFHMIFSLVALPFRPLSLFLLFPLPSFLPSIHLSSLADSHSW